VTERDRRAAENETMWRALNEADPPEPGRVAFVFCECGHGGCSEQLSISWRDYELVRADAARFVLVPGHEDPRLERVVGGEESFVVVEKQGEAAAIAERADPRS
jgi:hypothetical protein